MLCTLRRMKIMMGTVLVLFVTCHHFPSIPIENRSSDPFSSWTATTNDLTVQPVVVFESNSEDISTRENPSVESVANPPSKTTATTDRSIVVSIPKSTLYASRNSTGKSHGVSYKTTRNKRPTYEKGGKYLLYMAQSGWSNQKKCLMNVYYIARRLNRTLILPPVLPHQGTGATTSGNIMSENWTKFEVKTKVQDFYLRRLPANLYLPMNDVLDIPFSFNDVPTIDVRDFYSDMKNGMATKWVVESKYSHFDTIWIHNRSDLEGSTILLERKEYGYQRSLHQTYRDVSTLNKVSSEVLVILDAFKMVLDDSMTTPAWQSRLSQPIRQTARTILEKWNVPVYAAIHIRGGDGFFMGEEKVRDTIQYNMARLVKETLHWLEEQKRLHGTSYEEVGLFVATDLPNLSENIAMKDAIMDFKSSLSRMDVTLRTFLSGGDDVMANEIRTRLPKLLYKELLVDMQLAICADIAFVGTALSSFSGEIKRQRLNQKANCDTSLTKN